MDIDATPPGVLLRHGVALEVATLAWNVVGVVVLAVAASTSGSVALVGFGFDTLIEIGASTVVVWELTGSAPNRRARALSLIGWAFASLAAYLAVQSTWALATEHHASRASLGIGWTAATAAVMFALARGKARTGARLGNPVLRTEGRVTFIDGVLASAVLVGLVLDARWDWWWADPLAGLVVALYAGKEAWAILRGDGASDAPDT